MIHVDVVTVQLICFSESDVPLVHMFAVFYAYLPVDMQMMCHPNDLISLTFWGKSCLSHMGHASSNCTIHLLRHGSMLHPKDGFVIMVGDN